MALRVLATENHRVPLFSMQMVIMSRDLPILVYSPQGSFLLPPRFA